MADLQFQEEQQYQRPAAMQESPLIRLVLRTGIVSSEQAAEYVLLAIAVIAFIVSGFLLFGGTSENTSNELIQRAQQVDQRQFVQP